MSVLAAATDPAIVTANLDALRIVDATAARAVESAALPAGLELRATRDAALNYWWPDAGGGRWLGRTSLPAARSAGLIESFAFGPGNVLLVECGGGHELLALLQRLPAHAAVFVIEPDVQEIALLLRLHDVAQAVAARRLWLFAGDGAWDAAADAMRREPGLLPPQRVLAWPWWTTQRVREITERVTALAADVGRHREARLRELAAPAVAPRVGSTAVLALHPSRESVRLAERLAWGLDERCVPATRFCRDAPARMHSLALAEHLHATAPERAILVDALRADADRCLMPDVRVISWLSPGFNVSAEWIAAIGPRDRLVVSTAAQLAAARAAGFDATRLVHLPPAARIVPTTPRRRGVLVADVGGTDARAVGLTLTSHVALWNELVAVVERVAGACTARDAERLLRDAEHRSGVSLDDADVRTEFVRRVREFLIPTLVNRAIVHALQGANIEADVYGEGWPATFDSSLRLAGVRPPADTAYDWVIHGAVTDEPDADLLDAVAAGAVPMIRVGSDHRLPDAFGALLGDRHVLTFASPDELVRTIRQLSPAADNPAAQHVRSRHTWALRLDELAARWPDAGIGRR
ncbi:MAG: hypothetical protein L6Q92_12805 [Phycisphaerae bacterium]|nr:hypothetical protein [Phycisphaerae bacterium]